MRKIIYLLLLIQSGLIMAQTETVVTVNGKRIQVSPNATIVPVVESGKIIAKYVNGPGSGPVEIKETITSLEDIVTQETDIFGQIVDKHTLTYTNENGIAKPIDLSLLVKGTETLTSLNYDGETHELIYIDENGKPSKFDMGSLVSQNETLTKLEINNEEGTLDYTDENNIKRPLDIVNLVKEPWYNTATKKAATTNTDNLYTQGWVGIGFEEPSSADGEKLRVNGSITAVNSYYADYVFEDYFKGFSDIKADYKFKKLEEVANYISEHKHLPGITPINELVKTKEGYSINVSELSIQLLEKTEELYLHIIEQDKELEAKTNEIQELEASAKAMNLRIERLEKLISEK